MSIGQNIKRRRHEMNMTLEDVAKLVGISRQTLSRYETGVIGNIPSDKIEALAEHLHTTPSYLMGWDTPFETQGTASTIGEMLAYFRRRRNLSQQNLAEQINLPLRDIEMYESDSKIPDFQTLKKFCLFFETDIDAFNGKYSSEFIHSNYLIDIYFTGIMIWSEDWLVQPCDTELYRMHFSDLLRRYKELIEHAVNLRMLPNHYERHLYEIPEFTMSNSDLIDYYSQNLQSDIESLYSCIRSLPHRLAMTKLDPDFKPSKSDKLDDKSAASSATISISEETQFLLSYHSLNDEGRAKAVEYLNDLAQLDKYKKDSPSNSATQNA